MSPIPDLSQSARDGLRAQLDDLVKKDTDEQLQFFLKSFIMQLGDEWKIVVQLCSHFKQYLADTCNRQDLDVVQAAEFLQRQGRTRTALQRKTELQDIDLNNDNRIAFTEYLLLHYKVMVLTSFFERHQAQPTVDLTDEGVGLTGVGDMLLQELFKVPVGVDAELMRAIEEFVAKQKARDAKIQELTEKAAQGGVKGMTAQTELNMVKNEDMTEMNRISLTLEAAKRRAAKGGRSVDQEAQRIKEEKEREAMLAQQAELERQAEADKLKASRAKLLARAALFEKPN